MIHSLSILGLLYLLIFSDVDWGKTGHQMLGALAQQYLTPKAQREIDKLLDGASLASVSTYGDEIKSYPKHKALGPWHYINLPIDLPLLKIQSQRGVLRLAAQLNDIFK